MQTITIHKATQADAPAIAQMARELAAFEGERSLASAEGIARALSQSEPRCYGLLASAEGKRIGFALYYGGYDVSSDSYGFHLADMYVCEAYRAQGIGKKLLAHIAAQAEQEERQWVSLTALAGNMLAEGFYAAQGFSKAPVHFYAIGAGGLKRIRSES